MEKIFFALVIFILCSCGKDDPGVKPKNQTNHMEATVTYPSGTVVTLNETGNNVTLAKDFLGGYFATILTNQNQRVSISDLYGFECSFYPIYDAGGTQPGYNSYALAGDTIIYTLINDTHREGNFKFTCIKGLGDTVKVAGSFKGEFG